MHFLPSIWYFFQFVLPIGHKWLKLPLRISQQTKFLIRCIMYYFTIVTAFRASLNVNVVCKLILQPCCKFMLWHCYYIYYNKLERISKYKQKVCLCVCMCVCIRVLNMSICATFPKHLHCQTWLLGSIHFIVKWVYRKHIQWVKPSLGILLTCPNCIPNYNIKGWEERLSAKQMHNTYK
jgi:hypothetical protein